MLKFSDLSVDFKSYDNSFDSLMKLIPGSYYPLLVMYLAHKNLLKYKSEYEENDPRVLVSVKGKIMKEFFGEDLEDKVFRKVPGFDEKSDFETALQRFNDSLFKDRDTYVMIPFIYLMPKILEGKSVALVADIADNDQLLDLIKYLGIQDSDPNTSAALLYFSMMLESKYKEVGGQDESLSEKEIEDEKRIDRRIWVEDFEEAMNKIMAYSGDTRFSQPKEITRLILSQRKGGSIYNPFAGIASYNIQRNYDIIDVGERDYFEPVRSLGDYYYGEEINPQTWALGKLRLLAYENDSENYILADSTQWRGGEVNNILCTPPFGCKIENEFGKKEYADHFVVRRGLDLIVEDGLLACVVPLSFMSRKDTEDVRERIIKDGILESIVYLPDNIFKGTSIRTAILFIRKSAHKSVALINATDALYYRRSKLNVLDVELVANLLCHKYYATSFTYDFRGDLNERLSEETFYKLRVSVSNEKIENNDYDLTPGYYLLSNMVSPEGFTYKFVGDLAKGVTKVTKGAGRGKLIRPALLSKDEFTPLSADSLQEDDYKKGYGVVEGNALFYSPLSSMRPTLLLNPHGEKIYYKPDTLHAVCIKEGAVLPEYLVLELVKPYIQEQVLVLASGDVIPRLGLRVFLTLRIAIPRDYRQALKIEGKLVEDQRNLHFSKVNAELVALKDKQYNDYVKMLRQRKHRIQQVMNEFAPAFSLLDKCREKNGGILRDSDIVAARTGDTVSDYFSKLHHIIDKVEDLVTNLVDKEHWGGLSIVNIDHYVDEIPQHHLSDKYDIQILHDNDVYIEEEGETGDLNNDRFVFVNSDDLAIIFDNIIANADKWGFTDTIRRDYRIRIEVSDAAIDGKSAVRISISNNGNPIHSSVDRKRFFDWGYGSGTGIGTWQIKDIVEHYGGSIKLNENPEDSSGFVTEYEIILPLTEEN